MSGFPCISCGLCCRSVGHIGLPTKEDGQTCQHLDEATNLCRVYDRRPTICRVQEIHSAAGLDKHMTLGEWYLQNSYACSSLARAAGREELLVEIGK